MENLVKKYKIALLNKDRARVQYEQMEKIMQGRKEEFEQAKESTRQYLTVFEARIKEVNRLNELLLEKHELINI